MRVLVVKDDGVYIQFLCLILLCLRARRREEDKIKWEVNIEEKEDWEKA